VPEHALRPIALQWVTVLCGAPPDIAMPRAPLEDCLQRIPNHFDLCAVASKRARQLARGAPSEVPLDTHKSTVLALMEISRGLVDRAVLDEADLPPVESIPARFDPLDLLNE
jgi:DNA-directed RNA polymerase subunit omega